jgi:hypothetical protein
MPRKTRWQLKELIASVDEYSRFNALLWESQRRLEREIGTEAVNELIAEFSEQVRQDRTLLDALYMQDDPYRWAYERMRRLH